MTMPAVNSLRKARPEAHITMFTPEKLAELWRPPSVDAVLTFERDIFQQMVRLWMTKAIDDILSFEKATKQLFENNTVVKQNLN